MPVIYSEESMFLVIMVALNISYLIQLLVHPLIAFLRKIFSRKYVCSQPVDGYVPL